MTYNSTLTSKGQVTIPVEIRRKLGLVPGSSVQFSMDGDRVRIEISDWLKELRSVQGQVAAHLKKHNIGPLTDEELDNSINEAAQQAALERYQRSLE